MMSPQPDQPVGFDNSSVEALAASNGQAGDLFGHSVAISGDGDTVAVGAPAADTFGGGVYVYTRSGSAAFAEAAFRAADTTENDNFGWSVALSDDGLTLAVGATGRWDGSGTDGPIHNGTVYVFTRATADASATWAQQAEIIPDPSALPGVLDYAGTLGASVSLSSDGNTLAAGEPGAPLLDTGSANSEWLDAGIAHVYTRSGSAWSEVGTMQPTVVVTSNDFGVSLSLSGDGTRLAIGAPGEASAATGIDGDADDGTQASAGAVYLFAPDATGAWTQRHYIKAAQDVTTIAQFGQSVAMSRDGSTLAVGAPQEPSNAVPRAGAAYAFAIGSDGTPVQQAALATPAELGSVALGTSVALSADGSTLVAGAELTDDTGTPGVVLTASPTGVTWTTPNPLVGGPQSVAGDEFGAAVALDDDGATLAVGAPSTSPGPDGPGAAYVYDQTTLQGSAESAQASR
jgi:hypothetical protein|nr:hypothetical protein [Kofleriaceae bacterium]